MMVDKNEMDKIMEEVAQSLTALVYPYVLSLDDRRILSPSGHFQVISVLDCPIVSWDTK